MTPPRRVLRVIARLNIGGPAIQAITLSTELEREGFTTTLVRGREAEREGTMDDLAAELGVRPLLLPSLGREVSPLRDLRAAAAVRRIIRRERPDVLHTHTAKAGTVGRLAALAAGRRRPRLVVHTFHGHVLSGYFTPRAAAFFAGIERFLARRTDVLVAVSPEVRDDLLELGIGRPEQIRVVPLGFDLSRFALPDGDRARRGADFRRRHGIPPGAPLVAIVARLVPIKRIDVFLAAAEEVAAAHPDARFLVAGDGELADELRASPAARRLGDRVLWPGFVRDTPDLYAASDVVVLTSDNEGTPVSLIEALAAAVPAVATRVGGVPSVVRDGETGLLAPAGDGAAVGRHVSRLLADRDLARSLAAEGRRDVTERFALSRLVRDIAGLYRDGLDGRGTP
ncbi:MAG: glycosyltransferase [Actinomycetota bacterium]